MDLYQKLEGGMGIAMGWSVLEPLLSMSSFSPILCTAFKQRSSFRKVNKETGNQLCPGVPGLLQGRSQNCCFGVPALCDCSHVWVRPSVMPFAFELPTVTPHPYSYRYFPINSLFRQDRLGWNHCFDLSLVPFLG